MREEQELDGTLLREETDSLSFSFRSSHGNRHGARVGDPLDWRHLAQEIDDLLEHYNLEAALANPNLTDCGSTSKPPLATSGDPTERHCIFDIRQLDR